MKRSPLARRTPLRSHTGINRGSSPRTSGKPVRAVSKQRARELRQRTAMLAPIRAAQTWCTRCGRSGVGLDAHELLSRARGGSITDPSNVRLLCRRCHDDVTFRHHEIPDAGRWVLSAFGGAA